MNILDPEDIARVCHEANRAIQIVTGDDNVSPEWDSSPKIQRDSIVAGVMEAQAGATPEQLHAAWVNYKQQEGWTYGERKSFEALTHPNLLPYSELPPEQRLKDQVFQAIVKALS